MESSEAPDILHCPSNLGLEGIVAKRRDRPYRSGRSADWIKVKNPDAPAAMRIMDF
jgi:bifunctional non-homologous end joining protein LigD